MTRRIPFCKMDVAKTERRLADYAEKGWLLTGMKGRKFILENGEPQKLKYKICREKKCGGNVPKRILEKGWQKAAGSKNYYVVCTSADSTEAGPSSKSWVSYYRKLEVAYFLVACCIFGMLTSEISWQIDEVPEERSFSAIILFGIIIAIFLALFFRIYHSNKKLTAETAHKVEFDFTVPKENFIYSKAEEKAMRKSGQIMKKFRPFWFSSPDKTAEMIKNYAAEGWKFYRFSRGGDELFFVKSEPCNMKFEMDFLHEITDEYIAMTREDGWKLEFTSIVRTDAYCIWTKTYADGEEEPELYSDRESYIGFGKLYMKRMILPALVLSLFIAAMVIAMYICGFFTMNIMDILFIIFCTWYVVVYGIFSVISLFYYRRFKKKINEL